MAPTGAPPRGPSHRFITLPSSSTARCFWVSMGIWTAAFCFHFASTRMASASLRSAALAARGSPAAPTASPVRPIPMVCSHWRRVHDSEGSIGGTGRHRRAPMQGGDVVYDDGDESSHGNPRGSVVRVIRRRPSAHSQSSREKGSLRNPNEQGERHLSHGQPEGAGGPGTERQGQR